MAVANYQETNGKLPPAFINGPDGRPWHSWRVLLLPFLEESELYKEYRFDEPWNGPNNSKLAARMPRVYAFHAKQFAGNTTTNYLAVVGRETVWPGSETIGLKDVQDGTGSTILIVENLGANVHWMEPRDLDFATMDFRINRSNGISSPYQEPAMVTLDDSVFRLWESMAPATLRALLTRQGGEAIQYQDEHGSWELLEDGRNRQLKAP